MVVDKIITFKYYVLLMINGIYYQYIYLLIVSVLGITVYQKYRTSEIKVLDSYHVTLMWAMLFALFIGTRPPYDVLSDTGGMVNYYKLNLYLDWTFSWDTSNYIFDNLLLFLSSEGIHYSIWLIIMALFYFVGNSIACKKLFPENSFLAFVTFLGAFVSYSSAVNGFKAGIAAAMFTCAIAYRKNKIMSVLFLFLSLGFHHGWIVCVIAYFICLFIRKDRLFFYFWLFALIISASHITYFQVLFASLGIDDKASDYLIGDNIGGRGGFRLDFILYSVVPILQWFILKKRNIELSDRYRFVISLYMLLNGVWMLCMYANFTNRIAAYSWGFYYIVILLPCFESKNNMMCTSKKTLVSVMTKNLLFTLFMQVIYYGIIYTVR